MSRLSRDLLVYIFKTCIVRQTKDIISTYGFVTVNVISSRGRSTLNVIRREDPMYSYLRFRHRPPPLIVLRFSYYFFPLVSTQKKRWKNYHLFLIRFRLRLDPVLRKTIKVRFTCTLRREHFIYTQNISPPPRFLRPFNVFSMVVF